MSKTGMKKKGVEMERAVPITGNQNLSRNPE
jgi:hypothetical protein